MRSPRLENVLWMAVELIMAFVCVASVLFLMLNVLVHNGLIGDLTDVDKYCAFIVSMIGATGVMICSTALNIADCAENYLNMGKDPQ